MMKRKFMAILLVAVFLIISLGVISATDDSDLISVKIVWDDNVDVTPDYVTVNLMKDGKIVDSAKLSKDNLWKTNFTIDDDGNYQVKEEISSDYSNDVKGNAKEGFVITNKLAKADTSDASNNPVLEEDGSNEVLGASSDQTPLEEDSNDDGNAPAASDQEDSKVGDANSTSNATSNSTSNSTGNSTTNSTANATADDDGDDDSEDKTTTKTTTITKTVTKKVPKEDKKKPADNEKLKKTGLPIIALVLAVFVAAFVPFSRKK